MRGETSVPAKKKPRKKGKIAKGRKGEKSHEMCFFPSFLFFSSYFPPFPIFSRNVILKNGQGFQAARLLSRRVFSLLSFLPTPFLLLSFLSSPHFFATPSHFQTVGRDLVDILSFFFSRKKVLEFTYFIKTLLENLLTGIEIHRPLLDGRRGRL